MKTSLKNFTKVLLGVAVLGGAALTQSFTQKPKADKKLAGVHRFYNKTGIPSTNPADFIYQDEENLLCQENQEKDCSAEWNLGTSNPVVGQAPPSTATIVPNSAEKGEYQEPMN